MIKLYLTAEQKVKIRQWEGTSRYTYNQAISQLKEQGFSSWLSVKTDLLKSLPEWANDVPYQIKSIAIRDACNATKQAIVNTKKTNKTHKPHFRARKAPERSIYIPKSAILPKGIYHSLLGRIRSAERIPESCLDSRLILRNGDFFIAVSYKAPIRLSENQARLVALDPGVRSFITFLSETSFGKIGNKDIGRIYRLCYWQDLLVSKMSTSFGRSKRRMKKALQRMRFKIRNLVDELHHKTALFFVKNFDYILIPKFETSKMVSKITREIKSKTARAMMTFSHYRFKQFLMHKAKEYGKVVLEVTEEYTSKTCSWSGEIKENLGGAKYIKDKNVKMDRDFNGGRGIFIKSLSDMTFRTRLAELGCSVSNC